MRIEIWILALAAALLVLTWAVWVEASRLDRLHRKVAASAAVLDRQLLRRATIAVELASAGVMDPVSSVLVGEAAFAALEVSSRGASAGSERADGDLDTLLRAAGAAMADSGLTSAPTATIDRERLESELSNTVRAALEDADEVAVLREEPGGAELVDALAAAWYRVQLARRFHNEGVAQTQRVRRKLVIRTLRLAGRAPVPQTVEFDDAWPEALGRPGASGQAPAV
ncbi:hypothetical protein [Pengzhenrongella sicca]|uniref:LemA family protein n=1 Tax=Pengzhenrongella sicca TaxID=2819238 RepID=A0A8A4ZC22_9MICO|nr:hypothetical protein [Pengzhenrongella sicca]QTE28047.1 hypothetical protein J4E96_11610 [Pengzhenrongella sicca]